MGNLIPFAQRFIAGMSTRTVSARKLHEFLGVKRDFPTWVKSRIDQYEFELNADYIAIPQKRGIGHGKGKTEYFLTVDMAKELAMVERNEKGRQARRYFIACEKKLLKSKQQKQLEAPALESHIEYKKQPLKIGGDFETVKERLTYILKWTSENRNEALHDDLMSIYWCMDLAKRQMDDSVALLDKATRNLNLWR